MTPSELALSEMGEVHQYTRGLFDFETKWNEAIWAANAVACGWVVAANPNYLEEFAVSLVSMFANGISIYGISRAIPRFKAFEQRLNKLAEMAAPETTALKPSLALNQLIDVLMTMKRVSKVLIIVWGITGIYKLLLHFKILPDVYAI